MRSVRGFALIELMIAVAVIAILAAIALPAYNEYRIRAAESACMAETKHYAGMSMANIANGIAVVGPPLRACGSGDTVVDLETDITALPQSPGVRGVSCTMANATCKLDD